MKLGWKKVILLVLAFVSIGISPTFAFFTQSFSKQSIYERMASNIQVVQKRNNDVYTPAEIGDRDGQPNHLDSLSSHVKWLEYNSAFEKYDKIFFFTSPYLSDQKITFKDKEISIISTYSDDLSYDYFEFGLNHKSVKEDRAIVSEALYDLIENESESISCYYGSRMITLDINSFCVVQNNYTTQFLTDEFMIVPFSFWQKQSVLCKIGVLFGSNPNANALFTHYLDIYLVGRHEIQTMIFGSAKYNNYLGEDMLLLSNSFANKKRDSINPLYCVLSILFNILALLSIVLLTKKYHKYVRYVFSLPLLSFLMGYFLAWIISVSTTVSLLNYQLILIVFILCIIQSVASTVSYYYFGKKEKVLNNYDIYEIEI